MLRKYKFPCHDIIDIFSRVQKCIITFPYYSHGFHILQQIHLYIIQTHVITFLDFQLWTNSLAKPILTLYSGDRSRHLSNHQCFVSFFTGPTWFWKISKCNIPGIWLALILLHLQGHFLHKCSPIYLRHHTILN
jgi:hypothetical protein